MIKFRNDLIGFLYRGLLKRVFFKFDEEKMHNGAIRLAKVLSSSAITKKTTSFCLNFSDNSLKQKIFNIIFENPIGLAAGFDKNAEIVHIAPSIGFGFVEVGSVTAEPCEGNPKPRLWRLPKSKSIVVHYGLKNDGSQLILERLRQKKPKIPFGVSVARTNSPLTTQEENGIRDLIKCARIFSNTGDYLTINISCPNSFGGQPFSDPVLLEKLLQRLNRLNIKKPIFLKMSPDLPLEAIDKIVDVADYYNISGFICSNLSKKRNLAEIIKNEAARIPKDKGGISGKPLEKLANQQISHVYRRTKGKRIIIGCGGIFSAEDAYEKIRLGASLLQMITGLIFEGPQIVSQINLGLATMLEKDGFKNISQAVGTALL
jgi:dihydroorotate dehydrogenase